MFGLFKRKIDKELQDQLTDSFLEEVHDELDLPIGTVFTCFMLNGEMTDKINQNEDGRIFYRRIYDYNPEKDINVSFSKDSFEAELVNEVEVFFDKEKPKYTKVPKAENLISCSKGYSIQVGAYRTMLYDPENSDVPLIAESAVQLDKLFNHFTNNNRKNA